MRAALAVAALALAAHRVRRRAARRRRDARLDAARRPSSTATATDSSRPGRASRSLERGERARAGRTLATFAQLTDTHVRDEESPARVPFLDRIGPPFTSTFRPQEAFSTQVLDAAVRALDRERPQAVFVTGDITDNAQRNELDARARRRCAAARSRPDSGAPGYDGVQAADSADPFYYRPDHDAPAHPGALAAGPAPVPRRRARRAVVRRSSATTTCSRRARCRSRPRSTRSRPATDSCRRSTRKLRDAPRDEAGAQEAVAALLERAASFRSTSHVPADAARRLVAPGEAERRLGHPRQDYTVDVGPRVRAILLDTVHATARRRAA